MTAAVIDTHTRSTPPPPTKTAPDVGLGTVAMVLAGLAFGGLGAYSSFGAVHEYLVPSLGPKAWLVPVGVDLGIAMAVAGDLWMMAQDMRTWWLRWLPKVFTAGTVYLNVVASASPEAAVGHVLLVSLWIAFVEALAHVVKVQAFGRRPKGQRERMDRIRWSRLLVAPITTVGVLAKMLRWEQRSYPAAVAREQNLQILRLRYRATHGRRWRHRIAAEDLLAYQLLRKGLTETGPAPSPRPPRTAPKPKAAPVGPAIAPAVGSATPAQMAKVPVIAVPPASSNGNGTRPAPSSTPGTQVDPSLAAAAANAGGDHPALAIARHLHSVNGAVPARRPLQAACRSVGVACGTDTLTTVLQTLRAEIEETPK